MHVDSPHGQLMSCGVQRCGQVLVLVSELLCHSCEGAQHLYLQVGGGCETGSCSHTGQSRCGCWDGTRARLLPAVAPTCARLKGSYGISKILSILVCHGLHEAWSLVMPQEAAGSTGPSPWTLCPFPLCSKSRLLTGTLGEMGRLRFWLWSYYGLSMRLASVHII